MIDDLPPRAALLYAIFSADADVPIIACCVAVFGRRASGWTPRKAQQRLGSVIADLNQRLAALNKQEKIVPGTARRTYRKVSLLDL
jgi:hypothetical protein